MPPPRPPPTRCWSPIIPSPEDGARRQLCDHPRRDRRRSAPANAGVAIGKAAAAAGAEGRRNRPGHCPDALSAARPGRASGCRPSCRCSTPFSIAFKPWILERADSVRPGPPPALDSETWARDYNEVKRLGGKASKDRTAHETLMARYRITPNMMPSFRLAADAPGRRPVENARMFAMLGMIDDDALMAIADAKLHYNFWRPVTAIRNGELDGNPATAPDTGWEPLITTPNHPEYPCGHCIFAAGDRRIYEGRGRQHARLGASGSLALDPQRRGPGAAELGRMGCGRSAIRGRSAASITASRTRPADEMGRKIARLAMAKVMRPAARRRQEEALSR